METSKAFGITRHPSIENIRTMKDINEWRLTNMHDYKMYMTLFILVMLKDQAENKKATNVN